MNGCPTFVEVMKVMLERLLVGWKTAPGLLGGKIAVVLHVTSEDRKRFLVLEEF